jgi:hypothetical protein
MFILTSILRRHLIHFLSMNFTSNNYRLQSAQHSLPPTPKAALSKVWVGVRSLAVFAGSIPPEHRYLSLVSGVCCWVEVSATGRALVQRSPTACNVSECDLETSTIRRPRLTRTVEPRQKFFILSDTLTYKLHESKFILR